MTVSVKIVQRPTGIRKPKTLVYLVLKDWPPIRRMKEVLRAGCRKRRIRFKLITCRDDFVNASYTLRDAEWCVIWHGMTPWSSWATQIRRANGLHCVFAETGWFEQKDHWHFDPSGIIGASSLCGPIEDVPDDAYQKARNHYEQRIEQAENVPVLEGAVLVPMQLVRDTSVYAYAPYKTNREWVSHVLDTFPDRPIVFKAHPKERDIQIDYRGRKDVQIARQGYFPALARKLGEVYGQTSTSLYESALIGADVTVLGRCPLYYHAHEADKLLRVMCQRQVKRSDRDYLEHIIG